MKKIIKAIKNMLPIDREKAWSKTLKTLPDGDIGSTDFSGMFEHCKASTNAKVNTFEEIRKECTTLEKPPSWSNIATTDLQIFAERIFDEFDRLGISTNQDPYSGLSVEPEAMAIKIYNDQGGCLYDGELVLSLLKQLDRCALSDEDPEVASVWDVISVAMI